ncbi:N-acetyltransferase [Methanocella sp. CWC-04]|uniref:N-acetyltransferase n=1 Tax=Methanooceanicella nereidis TaxID=2052831 RepID=A0AAP2REK2_9EURY|nr:GNAT family N-acetyltransferase [Methanocella sp. CWC-04]MCD1295868.1 N-acetyltransferase [Methanocella sp. CWC-04]
MNIPEKLLTERLIIRKFQNKDLEPFRKFMKDENATKYLLFNPEQKTEKGIKELFDWTISSYGTSDQVFSLVVADKNTDEYIGSIGVAPDPESSDHQIYWSILPEHWRKGYAAEATAELIYYLFETGIKRIVAYSHPENIASTKTALKAGMKHMGKIRVEWAENEADHFIIEKIKK